MTTRFSPITIRLDEDLSRLLITLQNYVFPYQGSGLAIVIDRDDKVVGVVTDADIRRFLSSHRRMPEKIEEVIKKDFLVVKEEDNTDPWIQIASQLEVRGWKSYLPVRFVPVTRFGKLFGLIDLEEHQNEISMLRDQICIIGMGYVGLTLALAIESHGRKVIGIDNNEVLIKALKQGSSHIYEPGIDNLLNVAVKRNLRLLSHVEEISRNEGFRCSFILCLPTPLDNVDDSINTKFMWEAIYKIKDCIQRGDSLVMRSTVPVGFGRRVIAYLESELGWKVGDDFHYISAPERTVEGDAISEISRLPQLIGAATKECLDYGTLILKDTCPILVPVSNIETAELCKITSNAYRDYTFAFANHMALVSQEHSIDIDELIHASNFGYPRSTIPSPSPGVGGPCLSKDPYLLKTSFDSKSQLSPIVWARRLNQIMPTRIVEFLENKIEKLSAKEVLVIGIAFKGKPAVKDLRNSTSLEILSELRPKVKRAHVFDAICDLSSLLDQGVSVIESDVDLNSIEIDPDVILILNNHELNAKSVDAILSKSQKENVYIFDPWRTVNPLSRFVSTKVKQINYINMSTLKEFRL